MTDRYGAAFDAYRQSTAQTMLDARVAADLWDRHGAEVAALARQIAGGQALRQAVAGRDRAVLEPMLVEEWRRGVVSSGTITLLGLGLYAPDFTPIAAAWRAGVAQLDRSIITTASAHEAEMRRVAETIRVRVQGAVRGIAAGAAKVAGGSAGARQGMQTLDRSVVAVGAAVVEVAEGITAPSEEVAALDRDVTNVIAELNAA